MEKENQRVRLTKRLLKESLIEMLKEMGIEKISISELCKRSGINRTTFYLHYATPKDLLRDIERDFSVQSARILQDMDRSESLEQHLAKVCELIHENAGLQKIIFRNSTDEEIAEVFKDAGFPIVDTSVYFSNYTKMDEAARRLTSAFVNYGIFSVIRQWIMNDIPKSPREVAEIIYNILQPSLRP